MPTPPHAHLLSLAQVAPTSVQVYGMGKWGAFLASPSGNDWQLFVIKKTADGGHTKAAKQS